MIFNLLDIILITFGFGMIFAAIILGRKKWFHILYFFIFFLAGIFLIAFTIFPWFREYLSQITGISRGADAIVYISIIILFYINFFLIQKIERQRQQFTELIREIALQNEKNHRES